MKAKNKSKTTKLLDLISNTGFKTIKSVGIIELENQIAQKFNTIRKIKKWKDNNI